MTLIAHFIQLVLDLIFPPRDAELRVRHASEDELLMFYRPRIHRLSKSFITSLMPYHEPLVQSCVTEAKFRANKKAQRMLGRILAHHVAHIQQLALPLTLNPVFAPVPLGIKRRKERGYNQVEEIARAAHVPLVLRTLIRIRETVPQTTLDGKMRRKNVRDAFGVALPLNPAYLYIVVDDVLTTGSTLSAAGRALAAGGARPISLLALAH